MRMVWVCSRYIAKGDENGKDAPISFLAILITLMAIYGRVSVIAGNENEI